MNEENINDLKEIIFNLVLEGTYYYPDEYREANQVLGMPMSKKSFCMRFGIIKG